MLAEPFYDVVHRWTYASKNSMSRVAGPIDRELMMYRRHIRSAVRFTIDDELLEHLVYLSNTPDQDQFLYWSLMARLPYDTIWIEWDQLVRLRLSDKLGKLSYPIVESEISKEHGMLLVRDLQAPSKWVAYTFVVVENGEVMTNPLVMVFDPDGEDYTVPIPLQGRRVPTMREQMQKLGLVPVSALGEPPLHEALGIKPGMESVLLGYTLENGKSYGLPNWAVNKIGLIEEPIWRKFRRTRIINSDAAADIQQPYTEQAYENRGIIRSVIALLALLNNVPKILRQVQPRKGHRLVSNTRVSYLGHHTIALKLPKTRQIEYIQQRLRLGYGRLRRHDVRGFYRRTTNDQLGIRCHHIPTADSTSDHITCGRCGSSIRWVNEFQRGDEKLGFVQKTYKLGLGVLP